MLIVNKQMLLQGPVQNFFSILSGLISEIPEELRTFYFDEADVAVTSPPYNVRKTYKDGKGKQYDDDLTLGEYAAFLRSAFRVVYHYLRKDGVFFLNAGDPAGFKSKGALGPSDAHLRGKLLSEVMRLCAEDVGFICVQRIIWVKSILGKGHFTPSGGSKRFNDLHEVIWVLVKHRRNYRLDTKRIGVPYTDKANVGRYSDTNLRDPGNVWFMPYEKTTGKTKKKGHPAPFPVELPYRCIKSVPDAELAFDPFAGVGTTLQAANLLDVHGVGIDLCDFSDVASDKIIEKWEPRPYRALSHMEKGLSDIRAAMNNSKAKDTWFIRLVDEVLKGLDF